MGISDFLFEGRAPPSVTTYGATTSNIPQWMNDYNQGLVSRANAIAAEPYQTYGGPRLAGLSPDTENAFSMARQAANAYQSPLQQALGLTDEAVSNNQGGLGAAAQRFPDAVSQYMDPYIGNVIDRSKLEAKRFYDESIDPSLSNKFTSAGQYGSAAHMREANRAGRDLTEGLDSLSASQLSGAYTNAGQMFNQDQNRQLAVAQTKLDAGRQYGALGEANQRLGLQGADALNTIGQQQQAQEQGNLNLAYQDFQNQTNYPRETVDWLSSVIRGMPAPVSGTSTSTGPASQVGPSGLQQLGSAATAAKGIWDLYQDYRGNQPEEEQLDYQTPSVHYINPTGGS